MSDRHPQVFSSPNVERKLLWAQSDLNGSLSSKMGDFYLHTPTVNQNASFPQTPYIQPPQTPGFHSPASFHTPAFSGVQSTPVSAGAFAPAGFENGHANPGPPDRLPRELRYSPGGDNQLDMSGGLNIAFEGFLTHGPGHGGHEHSTSVDTIPEEDLPKMHDHHDLLSQLGQHDQFSGGLLPGTRTHGNPAYHGYYQPETFVKQEGYLPKTFGHVKPEDFLPEKFGQLKHDDFLPKPFVQLKNENYLPSLSQGQLHQTSPFTHKALHSTVASGNEPITIEDLLKEEPFGALEKPASFSCIDDGDDDLLSLFFDFEDDTPTKKTPPSTKPRASKSASTPTKPPRHKIPTFSAVASDNSTSKQVRKCKSFSNSQKFSSQNAAGPAFSLEECSNEFHVTEGNYSFQDETDRLSMQLGPGLAPKKNASRTANGQSRPVLKKSKTTSNLCLPRSGCRSPKVLKNMELGLVSFQVKLKNSK